MRIAVISDMHGNCLALDAVLPDTSEEEFRRLLEGFNAAFRC